MNRNLTLCVAALAALLAFEQAVHAQVRVRAPFVEVDVGPGVRVRAPFVNLWIPTRERVVVQQPAPPQPQPQPAVAPETAAEPISDELPAPRKEIKGALTVQEFSKVFKAREGIHEVTVQNPFTKTATNVRFTLPEGTPERVIVDERKIEFVYGPRNFVRIEFDEGGAIVTSRR